MRTMSLKMEMNRVSGIQHREGTALAQTGPLSRHSGAQGNTVAECGGEAGAMLTAMLTAISLRVTAERRRCTRCRRRTRGPAEIRCV